MLFGVSAVGNVSVSSSVVSIAVVIVSSVVAP